MPVISKFRTPDRLQITFRKDGMKYSYRITRIGYDRTPIPDARLYQLQQIADKIVQKYERSHIKA